MTEEIKKYKATSIQIAGFSMMAPIGNLIINILQLQNLNLNLFFLFYLVFCLGLLLFGIILVSKGIEILEGNL